MTNPTDPTADTPWSRIGALLAEENLTHFGFAPLARPLTLGFYESWLEKGYAGEMEYLRRHLPFKQDPSLLMKEAQSAIVIAFPYVPHPFPRAADAGEAPGLAGEFALREAKVALYARGEDYHFWIKRRLAPLITRLKDLFPEEVFAVFTDSAPVLERDLAVRAGLGWVGKNTCLIDRSKGSLFLLAEIFTSLEASQTPQAMHDFCGTCTRCLDACPTGALTAPRELDARKCISYLTIEAKSTPPMDLRDKMGGWFFGCDICQTVCPWNLKVHGRGHDQLPGFQPALAGAAESAGDLAGELSVERRPRLLEEMRLILTSSNSRLAKLFAGTPLIRAGGVGLKRNAILVCVHFSLSELAPQIAALAAQERLTELVAWALERLEKNPPGEPDRA